mmetsp:Transcript_12686/g.27479  ORF Transcript_12686/g.27479 Transcript_12686/m.27479 type:complete len:103 (+) Transcript_12686:259-567(+)
MYTIPIALYITVFHTVVHASLHSMNTHSTQQQQRYHLHPYHSTTTITSLTQQREHDAPCIKPHCCYKAAPHAGLRIASLRACLAGDATARACLFLSSATACW